MPEYLNNKKLEEDILRYRDSHSVEDRRVEFKSAEMELTKSFYILSEKIFLAYKYIFARNVDWDEALQEGTMICFEKIHRFNPQIGRAFPFFTQIIVNHFKQLCRTSINQRNLTLKYHQHLCDRADDPYIQAMRSKGRLPNIQTPSSDD